MECEHASGAIRWNVSVLGNIKINFKIIPAPPKHFGHKLSRNLPVVCSAGYLPVILLMCTNHGLTILRPSGLSGECGLYEWLVIKRAHVGKWCVPLCALRAFDYWWSSKSLRGSGCIGSLNKYVSNLPAIFYSNRFLHLCLKFKRSHLH